MRRRWYRLVDDSWELVVGGIIVLTILLVSAVIFWGLLWDAPADRAVKHMTTVCVDGYRYLVCSPRSSAVAVTPMFEEAPGGGVRPMRCVPAGAAESDVSLYNTATRMEEK